MPGPLLQYKNCYHLSSSCLYLQSESVRALCAAQSPLSLLLVKTTASIFMDSGSARRQPSRFVHHALTAGRWEPAHIFQGLVQGVMDSRPPPPLGPALRQAAPCQASISMLGTRPPPGGGVSIILAQFCNSFFRRTPPEALIPPPDLLHRQCKADGSADTMHFTARPRSSCFQGVPAPCCLAAAFPGAGTPVSPGPPGRSLPDIQADHRAASA